MQKEKKSRGDNIKTLYAISFAWQLRFLVAIPIGGFLLLGLWGDAVFGTHPFLLFAGIVVGLGTTAYEVYHSLFLMVKDKNKHDQY